MHIKGLSIYKYILYKAYGTSISPLPSEKHLQGKWSNIAEVKSRSASCSTFLQICVETTWKHVSTKIQKLKKYAAFLNQGNVYDDWNIKKVINLKYIF